MDYKKETMKTYDQYAKEYSEESKAAIQTKSAQDEVQNFLNLLPKNARILDLGSGNGDYALLFKKYGHNPLCLDLSKELLKICKEKGLETKEMDFERLDFKPETFDAIWAVTSLLHTKKEKLPKILQDMHKIMKLGGVFFLTLKEGEGEGFRKMEKYPDTQRWFSWYKDEELRPKLEKHFKIHSFNKSLMKGKAAYLNYILIK